jgi:hypothetical protein
MSSNAVNPGECLSGAGPGMEEQAIITAGCERSRHAKGSPCSDDATLTWLRQVDARVFGIARRYSQDELIPGDVIIIFARAHAAVLAEEGVTVFLFPCADVQHVVDLGTPWILAPR